MLLIFAFSIVRTVHTDTFFYLFIAYVVFLSVHNTTVARFTPETEWQIYILEEKFMIIFFKEFDNGLHGFYIRSFDMFFSFGMIR